MKCIDKFRVTAPARADLAGGTLDLWPLTCLVSNPQTINIAIDLLATADFEVVENPILEVQLRSGLETHTSRKFGLDLDLNAIPNALRFPSFVINQFLMAQDRNTPRLIRINLGSMIPMGSGLGGSSTLLIALARGLCRIYGEYLEQGWQWRFVHWAKDTEAAFLRMPTGTQDYLAALFGGLCSYEFQMGKIHQTIFPSKVFQEFKKRLLVVFSGEKHHSGLSNWEVYKKAVDGNQTVLSGLQNISNIAQRLSSELKKESIHWPEIGRLLDEEWKVRQATFEVSTPTLEAVIQEIRKSGVLGVKVCGAAQGGSLVAIVEPSLRSEVAEKLKKAKLQLLSTEPTPTGVSIEDLSSDMD